MVSAELFELKCHLGILDYSCGIVHDYRTKTFKDGCFYEESHDMCAEITRSVPT